MDKTLLLKRRERLRDYEWSSYRDYAGLRRPAQWMSLETVLEWADLSAAGYRRELDGRITHDQLGLDWKGELAAGLIASYGVRIIEPAIRKTSRILSELPWLASGLRYHRSIT